MGWKPVEETGAKNCLQEDGGNSTVLVHLYCPLDQMWNLSLQTPAQSCGCGEECSRLDEKTHTKCVVLLHGLGRVSGAPASTSLCFLTLDVVCFTLTTETVPSHRQPKEFFLPKVAFALYFFLTATRKETNETRQERRREAEQDHWAKNVGHCFLTAN